MKPRFGIGIVRAVLGAAMLLTAAAVSAAGPGAVRKQVESSMLVTGRIEIDTQGSVTRYTLDQQDKLPVGVRELLAGSVPSWKFKPVFVDGRTVDASATMSVRLVATKLDDGNFLVGIRSASFGNGRKGSRERRGKTRMKPPSYPIAAVQAGVAGTVYLLVKVGRDGKVIDVATEQVNLKVVASDPAMTRWRAVLASSAMQGARRWSFDPPAQDPGEDGFWVMRVPVAYGSGPLSYGTWESYVPGPRQRIQWGDENEEGVAFSPDTLQPGGSYLAGSGLKLLTALSGS